MIIRSGSDSRPGLLALGTLVGILSVAADTRADGGFLAPIDSYILETYQQAFIVFDAAEGTEELIIEPHFRGNIRDFGWIVPVPSLPEVAAQNALLFRDSDRLTAPLYRDRDDIWNCSSGPHTPVLSSTANDDIHILNEQVVGIYQSLTIGATAANALTDSLESWGYLHEENLEQLQDALQYYIDHSWYFVAMRVDTTQFQEPYYQGTWYGRLDPVRFRFASTEIVYPMRISALSADMQMGLLIYACAQQRLTFPGATTAYANKLTGTEIRAIGVDYPALSPYLRTGFFLTKLRMSWQPEQITTDVYLTPADTDQEYREIRYTGIPYTSGLMLAVALMLLARPWYRKTRV